MLVSENIHIAQAIMERLHAAIDEVDCEIGFTDAHGNILCHTRSGNVGRQSEPAIWAVAQQATICVDDCNRHLFHAAESGVYIPLFHKRSLIGVVFLTGDTARLKSFAPMVSTTAEAMYDLESYKSAYWGKLDQRNIFTRVLLYCEEDLYPMEVFNIASKLNYSADIVRIPLMFILRYNPLSEERLISEFCKNPLHTKEDIICITRGQNAVVFKAISGDCAEALSRYREIVEQYVHEAESLCINGNRPFICNVGTMQNKLLNYHKAYRHSLWVTNYAADVIAEHATQINYFYDHVNRYLQSLISIEEYHQIFAIHHEVASRKEWAASFMPYIRTLLDNNMNVSATSVKLYLHRNTMLNWLNRMKAAFHMDPINSEPDRNLLQQLYYYCAMQKR